MAPQIKIASEFVTPPSVSVGQHKVSAPLSQLSHGQRLKQIRRRSGLTLGDVAAAVGVSKPTVWAWEQGKCRPLPERVGAIAEALGVDVADLDIRPPEQEDAEVIIDECRLRIAAACGVHVKAVRISIEL